MTGVLNCLLLSLVHCGHVFLSTTPGVLAATAQHPARNVMFYGKKAPIYGIQKTKACAIIDFIYAQMGKSTLNRCPRGEEIPGLPFHEQYLHAEGNIFTVTIHVNELYDRVGVEGRKRGGHSLQIAFMGTNCDDRTCENLLMSTHASHAVSALSWLPSSSPPVGPGRVY